MIVGKIAKGRIIPNPPLDSTLVSQARVSNKYITFKNLNGTYPYHTQITRSHFLLSSDLRCKS